MDVFGIVYRERDVTQLEVAYDDLDVTPNDQGEVTFCLARTEAPGTVSLMSFIESEDDEHGHWTTDEDNTGLPINSIQKSIIAKVTLPEGRRLRKFCATALASLKDVRVAETVLVVLDETGSYEKCAVKCTYPQLTVTKPDGTDINVKLAQVLVLNPDEPVDQADADRIKARAKARWATTKTRPKLRDPVPQVQAREEAVPAHPNDDIDTQADSAAEDLPTDPRAGQTVKVVFTRGQKTYTWTGKFLKDGRVRWAHDDHVGSFPPRNDKVLSSVISGGGLKGGRTTAHGGSETDDDDDDFAWDDPNSYLAHALPAALTRMAIMDGLKADFMAHWGKEIKITAELSRDVEHLIGLANTYCEDSSGSAKQWKRNMTHAIDCLAIRAAHQCGKGYELAGKIDAKRSTAKGKTGSLLASIPRPRNNERQSRDRGGGRGGRGGRGQRATTAACFRCGEAGHFARECPAAEPVTKQGNGPRGGQFSK